MWNWAHRSRRLVAASGIAALVACTADPGPPEDGRGTGGAAEEVRDLGDEPVELFLRVEDDDLTHLYERDVRSNDRVPAAVRVGQSAYSPTRAESLRFRGNTSRRVAKKSFNLRTDERVAGIGSDRLNLNAMWTDPSQLREHLAWWMFDQIGHPAPRSAYVNLHINEVYEGLYLFVERVDHDLLRGRGVADASSLVRDRSRFDDGAERSVFGSGIPASATSGPSLDELFDHRDDADWEALSTLISFVEATPPGERFAAGIADHAKVEEFVDWLALNALIADVDSYGDDYWLYLDGEDADRRWGVIPWDHDLAFGSHYIQGFSTRNHAFRYEFEPDYNPWGNELVRSFYLTPTLRERIDDRLGEFLSSDFEEPVVVARVREIAAAIRFTQPAPAGLEAFDLHPRQHFSEVDDFDLHVEAVEDFVHLRWGFLRNYLAGEGAEVDVATTDLAGVAAGERVLLTDQQGWTVAAFSPVGPGDHGLLTVEVDAAEAGGPIDRVWTVTHSAGSLAGDLELFYRNTTEADCGIRRCENWYVAGEEFTFTGDQRSLQMVLADNDGGTRLKSHANPYSNKVTARLELPDSGSAPIVLDHVER